MMRLRKALARPIVPESDDPPVTSLSPTTVSPLDTAGDSFTFFWFREDSPERRKDAALRLAPENAGLCEGPSVSTT